MKTRRMRSRWGLALGTSGRLGGPLRGRIHPLVVAKEYL